MNEEKDLQTRVDDFFAEMREHFATDRIGAEIASWIFERGRAHGLTEEEVQY